VVHPGVDIGIPPETFVERVLNAVKKAPMLFRKEMAVEKGSFTCSVEVTFPKELLAYPLQGFP
jgi:hypothetical protein